MSEDLLDLHDLHESWQTELRGERKSPDTLKAYRAGVAGYLTFCQEQGLPAELSKRTAVAWVASMADMQSATVKLRLTALKRFARWLADEEGLDVDAVLAVRPPKLDQKVVDHLSDRAVQAMISACDGNQLRDRRDKALVVLFTETGVRAAEMLAINLDDVNLVDCVATVWRGKGAKGRRVRFSPQCATVLDKYIRIRRRAGYGESGPLWVTPQGRLSYTGMKASLRKRAESVGIQGFHPHQLRHTSAVRWLRAGGSESGLMAQAGWQSRQQIDRYIKSAAESLASDEFDRLDLSIDPKKS